MTSEMPEDLRRTAFTAAGAWFYDHYLRDDLASEIARLLLAERERCAQIADEWNEKIGAPGGDAAIRGTAVIARLVAAAIRQQATP